MEYTLQQIADRLKQAKRVLIVGHMRPDGDAIGSALALSCALKKLNISTQVCVESDIPSNLAFVNGLKKSKNPPKGSLIASFAWIVATNSV